MSTQLLWKLRRVAAGLRQHDIAARIGTSSSVYSQIERGDRPASPAERQLIEQSLPPLPEAAATMTHNREPLPHKQDFENEGY